MSKPNHDRIYLLPGDGIWCWADRPAPGIGQSDDDAVEYVRSDLFDQVTAQRDSATSQLETARTAINNNFNQLREHAYKMQAERDAALAQNAELVAMVDALRGEIEFSADAILARMPPDEIHSIACSMLETASKTPIQHLRDRDAEVARAGFVAGYMLCNDGSPLIKHNYQGFADKYAESIKAGKS